ncbi:MAG: hypothetical protein M3P30_05170 [Chloroflexota bacterium]|nr:hypothetical protein [Chloroflexota bacterium]
MSAASGATQLSQAHRPIFGTQGTMRLRRGSPSILAPLWREVRRLAVIAPTAAAASVLACSGGGDGTPIPDTRAAGTAAATGAHTRAEAALLTAADLKNGWVTSPPQSFAVTNDVCDKHVNYGDNLEQASTALERQNDGLFEMVAVYRPGQASTIADRVRAAFDDCQQWTSTQSGGPSSQFRSSPLLLPTYGDETVAARISVLITPGDIKGQEDFVLIRRGDTLAILSHLSEKFSDVTDTTQLADAADRKLAAYLAPPAE